MATNEKPTITPLKRFMFDHQIANGDLAEKLGVDDSTVSDYATGKVRPGIDRAKQIVAALQQLSGIADLTVEDVF